MSSENTITGRHGKLVVAAAQVARSSKWSVKESLATKSEWGDSDSEGYTNRAAGRRDATFDCEGKFDKEDIVLNLFAVGDNAEAVLWLDEPQADAADSRYYVFPRALCMDFSLVVDMDTEEVIGWTSAWGADGKYWRPLETDHPVKTLPA